VEHRRPVADQRRALDRRAKLAVLDQIGLGAREDELARDDVDLPPAEALGIDALLHAGEQLGRIVLAALHEGVGHPRHRCVLERLTTAVAGRLDAHQPGIEPVLHIALEDAVLDQHRLAGRGALVVDRKRPATIVDRAVVDHGHTGRGDALADPAGKGAGALAVEVAL